MRWMKLHWGSSSGNPLQYKIYNTVSISFLLIFFTCIYALGRAALTCFLVDVDASEVDLIQASVKFLNVKVKGKPL